MPHKAQKNHNWKGDKVGYKSLHEWIAVNWGRPNICEKCSSHQFTEWASKEGNYTRDRKDWLALCRSCHKKYDNIIDNLSDYNRDASILSKRRTELVIEMISQGYKKADIARMIGISVGHLYYLLKKGI